MPGSGDCQVCEGTGELREDGCPGCAGTGDCPTCGGSGVCAICKGEDEHLGGQVCVSCEGSGAFAYC